MKKNNYFLFPILIVITLLTSCNQKNIQKLGNFDCLILDKSNLAVGCLHDDYSLNHIFCPSKIGKYQVTGLGFQAGLISYGVGRGNLTKNINRFYAPSTIKSINKMYMKTNKNIKIFYCGATLDLSLFGASSSEFYVPSESYDDFYNLLDKYNQKVLYKANVTYHLNDGNESDYYYIDNNDYNSIITIIPPLPEREDYTFEGWYLEKDGINQWSFEKNKLPSLNEEETFKETKLFAKWIKK